MESNSEHGQKRKLLIIKTSYVKNQKVARFQRAHS